MTPGDELDDTGELVAAGLPKVVVAVCTYLRNEQLRRFLTHLVDAAAAARDRCVVGAVIVDDSPDRQAEPTVQEFTAQLPLGVRYRVSGQQNISSARNIGLEVASELGDWVAMTDDDCIPDRRWLVELVTSQRRTGADAISGRFIRRAPPGSPRWLVEQPFLDQGVALYASDTELTFASTHNSMIASAWLRDRPDLRFDARLGRLGGEDMLFFRSAHKQGLRITYSAEAIVYEDEPGERLQFRFLLSQALWLGNSTYVTSVEGGEATRGRMLAHGFARTMRAVTHPIKQLARRQKPQLRFSVALVAGGVGILLGALGVRIRHH